MTGALILKCASASRSSGEWKGDDYDVLAEGVMLGRIMKAAAAPVRIVDAYLSAITRTHADARLRGGARGRDGGVRQELAAEVVQLKPTTDMEAATILPP